MLAKPGMLVMSRPVQSRPTRKSTPNVRTVDSVDAMRTLGAPASIDRKAGLRADIVVSAHPAGLETAIVEVAARLAGLERTTMQADARPAGLIMTIVEVVASPAGLEMTVDREAEVSSDPDPVRGGVGQGHRA